MNFQLIIISFLIVLSSVLLLFANDKYVSKGEINGIIKNQDSLYLNQIKYFAEVINNHSKLDTHSKANLELIKAELKNISHTNRNIYDYNKHSQYLKKKLISEGPDLKRNQSYLEFLENQLIFIYKQSDREPLYFPSDSFLRLILIEDFQEYSIDSIYLKAYPFTSTYLKDTSLNIIVNGEDSHIDEIPFVHKKNVETLSISFISKMGLSVKCKYPEL